MKNRLKSLYEFLLKKLRWVIALIGLVLFGGLWSYVDGRDPSSASNSLIINLAATALAVSFTAFLIDWLHERRQQLLIAKPLMFAKHELNSVRFMFSVILGPPYLGSNYPKVLKGALNDGLSDMNGLSGVSNDILSALSKLTAEDCPRTSNELAANLTTTLKERIDSIDEILRLYGFALDAELRDSVHLLRDRIVGLRNVLDSFGLNNGLQSEPEMQKLVALQLLSLFEALLALKVEWTRAEE